MTDYEAPPVLQETVDKFMAYAPEKMHGLQNNPLAHEGSVIHFEHVPLEVVEKALNEDRVFSENTLPNQDITHEDFVAFARRWEGVTFHGYIVPEHREDHRIDLEGFDAPLDSMSKQDLAELAQWAFDEVSLYGPEGAQRVFTWYD